MSISVRLPEIIEKQLSAYCQAHRISRSEAVKQALDLFLSAQANQPTPYELGEDGFGADRTHTGDIARNSKRLLREKFRGQADR
jgi:hypothetical protein